MRYFAVEEDENVFNIFDREYDFDENGWYNGHEGEDGYHITDFDNIVYEANTFEAVTRWVNKHTL